MSQRPVLRQQSVERERPQVHWQCFVALIVREAARRAFDRQSPMQASPSSPHAESNTDTVDRRRQEE